MCFADTSKMYPITASLTSPIYSYTFHTKENLTAGVICSSATCQWVYREAVKTMSRRMAKEAFSILLPRTESPTTRAACRTSFSTSSRRCMLRTTVPSWTSVSWAISAKGCGGGRRTKKYSQTGRDRLDDFHRKPVLSHLQMSLNLTERIYLVNKP